MSAKYPEWWELPKERWQETTPTPETCWDAELRRFVYTGQMIKKRSWRDSQRQKLYNAESCSRGYSECRNRRFTSPEEISEYTNQLLGLSTDLGLWGYHLSQQKKVDMRIATD